MRNITEKGLPVSTRYFAWDEANRPKAVNKANTLVQHHLYDANGERSHKGIGNLFYMGINGGPQGYHHYIGNYQLYPSGYLTVGEYDLVTKHYFTGTQRIASRLAGDVTDFHAVSEQADYGVQTTGLKGRQENDINATLDQFKLSHPAIWNVPGMVPPCNQGEEEDELCACVFQHQCGTGPIYFFHSDHLVSSTFLTDGSGQPYQFLHNLPFGDVRSHPDIHRPGTMEEQFALSPNAWWKTPHLFNGKELVSRTSLYYYGARYYDLGLSVWLSVDPCLAGRQALAEKYAAWTPYNYTMQNPILLRDVDGKDIIISSSAKGKDTKTNYMYDVLASLEKLTNDKLEVDPKTGKVIIVEKSDSGNKDFGTAIVRAAIEGFTSEQGDDVKFDIHITDNADGRLKDRNKEPIDVSITPITQPIEPVDASNGEGTNSIIYFTPGRNSMYRIGKDQSASVPSYIPLGHEIIYGIRNALGIRRAGDRAPYPYKNMEEYKTQQLDRQLFIENGYPDRFIVPIDGK